MNIKSIHPDLMVYARGERGGLGPFVGTVDHLEGEHFIKLKKRDSPDYRHHWIPLEWVDRVDEEVLYLNRTGREVHQGLIDHNPLDSEAA
jgi:hypothetical protein